VRAFYFALPARFAVNFSQAKIFFRFCFEKHAAKIEIDQKRANQ